MSRAVIDFLVGETTAMLARAKLNVLKLKSKIGDPKMSGRERILYALYIWADICMAPVERDSFSKGATSAKEKGLLELVCEASRTLDIFQSMFPLTTTEIIASPEFPEVLEILEKTLIMIRLRMPIPDDAELDRHSKMISKFLAEKQARSPPE